MTTELEIRPVNSRFINMIDVMGQGLAFQHKHNEASTLLTPLFDGGTAFPCIQCHHTPARKRAYPALACAT